MERRRAPTQYPSTYQVRDVRAAVAPIQDAALLPRQVPAPVPEHVRVVRLVAAEEAEGGLEPAPCRREVLEKMPEAAANSAHIQSRAKAAGTSQMPWAVGRWRGGQTRVRAQMQHTGRQGSHG